MSTHLQTHIKVHKHIIIFLRFAEANFQGEVSMELCIYSIVLLSYSLDAHVYKSMGQVRSK